MEVGDGIVIEKKTEELRSTLTDSKITPVSEFISQTLSGITDNMSLVKRTAIVISLLLNMLITAMFLQLITSREHSAIAFKKAIGFSNRDLRIQYGIRVMLIQFVAIVVGTILANFCGEAIFGVMLSSMGVSKITMLVEPMEAYLFCPIAQLLVVFVTVIVRTKVVRAYHIRNQILE